MAKVKAATLVMDFALYPRNAINDYHARELQHALEAGAKLPPVVADRTTKQIIDGFHRVTAALRIDPKTEIEVLWRDFADDSARFTEAMRLNATHGQRLSTFDMARCAIRAQELKIDPEIVAGVLQLSTSRFEGIISRKTSFVGKDLVPIKQTTQHLAQETLSRSQADGVTATGGKQQLYYVNQVINLIEADILDSDNERLMERLRFLASLLERALAAPVVVGAH